jgi:Zn-dependent M28 family amino/carboxypeptidase
MYIMKPTSSPHPLRRTRIARSPATLVLALAIAFPASAQVTHAVPPSATIDSGRLIDDLRSLSADSMEGRRTGTPGNERARRYLDRAYAEIGLQPIGGSFRHPFNMQGRDGAAITGVDFIGRIPGRDTSRVIVLSAHYDHLGVRHGDIFNGADDNASGTAAILAMARALKDKPPAHTVLIVAMDAEEQGLRGAKAFIADPPVPLSRIAIDVNLDMVSRNEKGELWVSGTYQNPFLRPFAESLVAGAPVSLRIGHDTPGTGSDDWTDASDHGPFHDAGIPFLYFGVEDHPDYHKATDEFDHIEPQFYVNAVETILSAVRKLDGDLDRLVPKRPAR